MPLPANYYLETRHFVSAQILSSAISGKLIMAQVTNPLSVCPAQNIDDVMKSLLASEQNRVRRIPVPQTGFPIYRAQ